MSNERLWGDGGIADQIQAMLNEETMPLRARLAEVEAERDLFRETHDLTSRQFVAEQKRAERAEAKLSNAEARLAEVERQWQRDHDEMSARRKNAEARLATALRRAEAAGARLAAVLALCDWSKKNRWGVLAASQVRAAAAGDRAAKHAALNEIDWNAEGDDPA